MRVLCLHKNAVAHLKELGADLNDLSPLGLDGSSYHLVTMKDGHAGALRALNVEYEDVTPRVLRNRPDEETPGYLFCRGGKIPNRTKLRMSYKSRSFEAEVRGGLIWLDGNPYDNPSAAARAVGRGSVNGWQAWEYFDRDENRWLPLKRLRHRVQNG